MYKTSYCLGLNNLSFKFKIAMNTSKLTLILSPYDVRLSSHDMKDSLKLQL